MSEDAAQTESAHQREPSTHVSLEQERIRGDLRLREMELDLRRDELQLKREELSKSRWSNPLLLGILAALVGFLGNIYATFLQGRSAREAEALKLRSSLILEAIKTGSPSTAATNLDFLVKISYLDDPDGKIAAYIKAHGAPFLPSATGGLTAARLSPSESVANLPPASHEWQLARAVGELQAAGAGLCTAWLVAEDLLVTAGYCVSESTTAHLQVRMGYLSSSNPGEVFEVDSVVARTNDDFALLRVRGTPGKTYGTLTVSTRKPTLGESVFVLHHALGGPLSLSRGGNCKVTAVNVTLKGHEALMFEHNCYTDQGSGGAPIFSVDGRVIGMVLIGDQHTEYALSDLSLILPHSRTSNEPRRGPK
jgi:hypothetical protein